MMESSPISLSPPCKKVGQDPFKRLSLAVLELDKLINRANQLAHLSEQPVPPEPSSQLDSSTPPHKA